MLLEKVCFQIGFEIGNRVNIANIEGERFPEVGCGAAEGSRTHGGQGQVVM